MSCSGEIGYCEACQCMHPADFACEPIAPEKLTPDDDYFDRLVAQAKTKALVDRFLAWPLPKSVCSDACVTDSNYKFPRSGTNLLTADEARQMIEYLLAPSAAENTERRLQKLETLGLADAAAFARNPSEGGHTTLQLVGALKELIEASGNMAPVGGEARYETAAKRAEAVIAKMLNKRFDAAIRDLTP